ncbi:MAG: carboxypeptidase regulatory-like domain-containing protein [Acidimicrobiales bacterium]
MATNRSRRATSLAVVVGVLAGSVVAAASTVVAPPAQAAPPPLVFDSAQKAGDLGFTDNQGFAVSGITADVDGDGDRDVPLAMMRNVPGVGGRSSAVVLPNAGSGTFGASLVDVQLPFSGPGPGPGSIYYGVSANLVDLVGSSAPDLVVKSSIDDVVRIRPGNGDGTFGAEVTVTGLIGANLRFADVDGDGRTDLAVVGGYGSGDYGKVAILRNTAGGWVRQDLADVGQTDIAFIDLAGNGRPSLLARAGGPLLRLPNDGNGTYGPAVQVDGIDPRGFAIGDFDGVGGQDALVVDPFGEVSLFANDGAGGLTKRASTVRLPGGGSAVRPQSTVDVDGDGRVDGVFPAGKTTAVVHADAAGALTSELWAVAPQTTDGAGHGQPTYSADIVDVTGDGRADLISGLAGNLGRAAVTVAAADPAVPGRFLAPSALDTTDAGGGARTLALADMDEDGRPDLVYHVSTSVGSRVRVARGQSSGAFAAPTEAGQVSSGCGSGARIATEDFDGDDHLDVVCVDGAAAAAFGDGAGHIGSPTGLPLNSTGVSGGVGRGMAIADFDVDGHPDVVFTVTNNCCPFGEPWIGSLVVQRYNPANPRTFVTDGVGIDLGRLSGVEPVVAGDFDGDGKPDIVYRTGVQADGSGGERFSFYKGKGDGTFAAPVTTAPGLPHLDQMEAGDVDGDGDLDIVGVGSGQIAVVPGNGDGTFGSVQSSPSDAAFDVTLADLNSDGRRDIVTGSWTHGVQIRTVSGAGVLSDPGYLPSAGERQDGVVTGDVDGDGRIDIVSTVYTNPHVTVQRNRSAVGPTGPPDLRPLAVSAPGSVVPGATGDITYTVKNQGGPVTGKRWIDRVYLSTDAAWDPTDRLFASVARSADVDAGATYQQTVTAPFLPIASGPHHVIVRSDLFNDVGESQEANNLFVAGPTVDLTIPVLAPGGTANLTLAAGQLAYLQVSPSGGPDQLLSLTSATSGVAELVAGDGRVPTPTDGRDHEAIDPAHPELLLPSGGATRYVLVRGRPAAGAGTAVAVSLRNLGFEITSVAPDHGSNQGSATVVLRGAGFAADATAALTRGGTTRTATKLVRHDATHLEATFDLTGLSVGAADLAVTNPGGGTASAVGAFQVTADAPGRIEATLTNPGRMRTNWVATATITVRNTGGTDLPVPLVRLDASGKAVFRPAGSATFIPGPLAFFPRVASGPTLAVPPGAEIRVDVPFLPSNELISQVIAGGTAEIPFRATVISTGTPEAFDWSAVFADFRPAGLSDETWAAVIAFVNGGSPPTTWGEYAALLADADRVAAGYGLHLATEGDRLRFVVDRALVFAPGASIRGRATVPGGAPAVGARVAAVGSSAADGQEVRVWPDGSFALRDLPPGTYRLEVSGYVQDVVPTVDVVTGTAGERDLVVLPGELVRGTVTRPPVGAPLADATVTLVDSRTGRSFTALTGSDGRYELPGMRVGTHSLQVEASGYLDDGPSPVTVGAGVGGGRDVTLSVGGSIRGIVRDAATNPVPGATVAAADGLGGSVAAVAGADGSYLIAGLRPGTFTVSASGDGHGAASQAGVVVADGAEVVGIDLTLLAGAGLTGVVRDGAGHPVEGATVTVYDPPGLRQSVTGPDGAYAVGSLGAGLRHLTVTAPGHRASELDVAVVAGASTTRDISLDALGAISGVVRLPDASPVPGVTLRIVDDEGQPVASTVTDAGGAYRFADIGAGTYQLVVQGGLAHDTVTLVNPGDVVVHDFEVQLGRLNGRVLDQRGQPAPYAELQVTAVGPATATPVLALTDADGRFSVVVRPGTFTVQVTDRRAPFASTDPVAVAVGEVHDVGDLVAVGLGVTVHVASTATGQSGVAGAFVGLRGPGGTLVGGRTDATGAFVLTGVPAGSYELLVRTAGLASHRQSITIGPADTDVPVDLVVGHRAGGQVLAPGGAPPRLAIITLVERTTGEVFSAGTEPDGTWQIDMLPPGAVLDGWIVDQVNPATRLTGVTAAPPPVPPLSLRSAVAAAEGPGGPAAGSRSPSAYLPSQPVSGKVSQTGGAPVSGATVELVDAATGQVVETTSTGPDGGYQLAGLSDLSAPVNIRVTSGGQSRDAFPSPKVFGDILAEGSKVDVGDVVPGPVTRPDPVPPEGSWTPPPGYFDDLTPPPLPGLDIGPDDPTCPPVHAAWVNADKWARLLAENHRQWTALRASYGTVFDALALSALRFTKLAVETYAFAASIGVSAGASATVLFGSTVPETIVGLDLTDVLSFFANAYNLGGTIYQYIRNLDAGAGDIANNLLGLMGDLLVDARVALGSQTLAGKAGVVGAVLAKVMDLVQAIGDLQAALQLERSISDNLRQHKRSHEYLERQLVSAKKALDAARKQGCKCPDGSPRPPDGRCPEDPPDAPIITQKPDGQWVVIIDGKTFVVNSRDPNSIDGPAGSGGPRFVTVDQPLAYTVHFENVKTASAPAQEVVVTHQLDADVDRSTFALGDVGFGSTRIEVPEGRRTFDTTVPLAGTPYAVAVTAGLDVDTGLVTWRFRTIDPTTGDLPTDPDAGFLPPNVTGPEGEGFVDYTATPLEGTALGSTVDAKASIVFDQNPPIETNTWTNTIGVLLPPSAGGFHAVTPVRILDPRAGLGTAGSPLGPGETRTLQIAGAAGLPTSGVTAVAINVTADRPTASSHLTVWPTGSALPGTSNLNFPAGRTIPNLVVSAVGPDGSVSIRNNSGQVQVIGDLVGWFDLGEGSTVGLPGGGPLDARSVQGLPPVEKGAAYEPLTPSRILDTRSGVGAPASPVGPGAQIDVDVTGVGGVPDAGVTAVVVNVTAVQPTATSHLTVWPAGAARPDASSLNFPAGATVPNLVIARVGADGHVSLFNNSGQVHVLFDVVGYFTTAAPLGSLHGLTPARLLDTRDGTGSAAQAFGPGEARELVVAGRGGVPVSGASAVVLNVTAVQPSAASHLTVWPAGVSRPDASNLNFTSGSVIPNLVVVKVGADGKVALFNNSGNVQVLADVVGYVTE